MKRSSDQKFLTRKKYNYGRIPSNFLYSLALKTILFFLKRIFNVHWDVDKNISRLQGPIIILGNHPSNIDPILLAGALYPIKINFLTASSYFHNSILRYLLYMIGTIPKTQFRADPGAVKSMLKVIRRNGVLGIFPEGSRSIDGTTQSIEDSITKLVKKTQANLVTGISSGAYLSWPRWTRSGIRRGRINIAVRIVLTGNDIKSLEINTLNEIIKNAISYSDYKWQEKEHIVYKSKSPAAGVDSILHRCPSCNRNWINKSYGNVLECRHCGNKAIMDQYGFFHPENENSVVFETVHDWNAWQRESFLKDQKDVSIEAGARMYVFSDESSSMYSGRGKVSLNKDAISFNGVLLTTKVSKSFALSGILGISARYGRYFDLIEDHYTYRFILKQGQKAIGFAHALEILREHKKVH